MDWEDSAPADDGEAVAEAPEDPNAGKRFWFEHATGAGKTVAAVGFVEASRTGGILILTHRRNLVDQFHGELARPRLRQADRARAARPRGHAERPSDGRDLPVVRPQRRQRLRRLRDRHLRRGAHRAGREDLGRDPRLDRPRLHRHDRDRRADRPSRHRPLPDPDVAVRPRPGRAPRRHLAAALRPDPTRTGRPHDRQGAVAPRRGRHRVRPGDAGRTARSAAVQPGRRRPLQDALQRRARRRLLGRCAPRLQRRAGVPRRRDEGAGGLGRDAQARAGPDPGPLRARRHRRAGQRAAAGRGLELAARDGLHAPGADRVQAHLSAARRPRHPPPPGQGGGHRRRLRASGDQARRPRRLAALAAGSRRLPRRRDRRRPGAPRPRAAAARRAPRAAGDRGREPPDRGLRARAVADRRRASRLRRAGPVGGAGRGAGRSDGLAAGARDAALRPGRRAQAHVPDHRRRSQQEPARCGCARCRRSPPGATPRRSTARWTSSSPGRATTSAKA